MKRTLHSLLLTITLSLAAFGCQSDGPEPEPKKPDTTVGTKPVPGPDGVPLDCNILHDGLCYKTLADAATAAGKDPAKCTVLESYPGQLACED